MFVLSRQEKIVLLLIIMVLVIFFGWKYYQQEKSTITIIPAVSENELAPANPAAALEEEICIIHIAGAVNSPGVYQLSRGKRVIDAVNIAGGPAEKAYLDAVNLAALIYDSQKIIIPYLPGNEDNVSSATAITDFNSIEYSYVSDSNLVNINSATARELETLPGIGPVLAERILEFRKNNGRFLKIEDIQNVSGIGQKRFDAIKELITVY